MKDKVQKILESDGKDYLDDLRHVIKTKEGRTVLWRIMSKGDPFAVVMQANTEWLQYNLGRQDLCKEILKDIRRVDLELAQLMEREAEAASRELSNKLQEAEDERSI